MDEAKNLESNDGKSVREPFESKDSNDAVPHERKNVMSRLYSLFTNENPTDLNAEAVDPRYAKVLVKALDSKDPCYIKLRYFCQRIVVFKSFEIIISAVIIFNALTIGIQTDIKVGAKYYWWVHKLWGYKFTGVHDIPEAHGGIIQETHFVLFYIAEFLLRLLAFSYHVFLDPIIMCDLILIMLGIASVYLSSTGHVDPLKTFMVFRLLRLLKVAGMVKNFNNNTLWLLLRGLLTAVETSCYCLVLIAALCYMFAIISLEVLTLHKDLFDGPGKVIIDAQFPNLMISVLTLFQISTFDSAGAIYVPLSRNKPYVLVFFMIFMFVSGIAMMNLITAVIVENALENARNDKTMKAMKRREEFLKLIPKFRLMFQKLDMDQSGFLERHEFKDSCNVDPILFKELTEVMGVDEPMEIYDMLDFNNDGSISIDEFCSTLMKQCESKRPIVTQRVLQMAEKFPTLASDITEDMKEALRQQHDEPQDDQPDEHLVTSNLGESRKVGWKPSWECLPPDSSKRSELAAEVQITSPTTCTVMINTGDLAGASVQLQSPRSQMSLRVKIPNHAVVGQELHASLSPVSIRVGKSRPPPPRIKLSGGQTISPELELLMGRLTNIQNDLNKKVDQMEKNTLIEVNKLAIEVQKRKISSRI